MYFISKSTKVFRRHYHKTIHIILYVITLHTLKNNISSSKTDQRKHTLQLCLKGHYTYIKDFTA